MKRLALAALSVLLLAGCGRDPHGVEFAEASGIRCPDLVALAAVSTTPVPGAWSCLAPSAQARLAPPGRGGDSALLGLAPRQGKVGDALSYMRFIGPGCPRVQRGVVRPAPDDCGPSFAYWIAYQHSLAVLYLDIDSNGLIVDWALGDCEPLYC